MKALRLTWLHSCLLGRRRHDYRGAGRPIFPSMDQHAFQGDRMKQRWEGRVAWATVVVVVVLMVLFFCTRVADFSTGVTCTACAVFIGFCCSTTEDYVSVSSLTAALDLNLKCLGCCPSLFLQQPHTGFTSPLCFVLWSEFTQQLFSVQSPLSCEKWVFLRKKTPNCPC